MALAIFDLDNTLIAGDSDYLWGVFLAEIGVVDREHYEQENERFYREYREGRLDIYEFLRFSLQPLKDYDPASLQGWRAQFLRERIDPIILPRAQALVESHRCNGDTLLIVTATNEFVTAPIAARFGVEHLIATVPARRDDRFTGEVAGIPSYREGKVLRLWDWLRAHGADLSGSTFYSDSHNDIPLLQAVEYPVAVDPDPLLRTHAGVHHWRIISLRNAPGESEPHTLDPPVP